MFIFGYALMTIGFKSESYKAKEFLTSLIQAGPSSNN